MNRNKIKENVFFNYFIDTKFKTNRISINLITNIDENTATQNALLSFVLSRGNKNYPKYMDFTKKLTDLYGADFSFHIEKFGNKHILSLCIQAIDNKFSLNGENIIKDTTNFVIDTLLLPDFYNDYFKENIVNVEKNKLDETIKNIINDKKEYTHKKANDTLFKGSKLSVYKYGSVTKLKEINEKNLTNSYKNLLENCCVEVLFTGCGDFSIAQNICKERLTTIKNDNFKLVNEYTDFSNFKLTEKVEHFNITQSKLCMLYTGFNSDNIEKASSIMRMANAIFGGSPFSKLFINVREKKSLCYYCDSSYDRINGVMSVECGVNEENIDTAISTINEQLTEIKNGNVSEKEIDEAKLLLVNAFNSMKDRLATIEAFYLGQIIKNEYYDIEEIIEHIKKVTKENVVTAFKDCDLKVIYALKSREDK